jgi:hypothetical protein
VESAAETINSEKVEVVDAKDVMVVKEGNDGTIRCISSQSGSNYGLADLVASCHPKCLSYLLKMRS